ncbi:hypothetical protein [Luteimicrobium album]|uniref:hypothetical protein n=1 Tax=Luteimicrobium album TaxID=1054550 RepID=UPI003D667754
MAAYAGAVHPAIASERRVRAASAHVAGSSRNSTSPPAASVVSASSRWSKVRPDAGAPPSGEVSIPSSARRVSTAPRTSSSCFSMRSRCSPMRTVRSVTSSVPTTDRTSSSGIPSARSRRTTWASGTWVTL